MSNWRIEQATLGTSSCKECGKSIQKGDWRFGKTVNEARWFHLRCAERGAPVVFPPFATEAKKILGDRGAIRRPLTEVDRATVASAGRDALPVLADWLQSKGDPWGELIALRLAGNHEAAVELFDAHLESFCGDLNPDDLEWVDGVIHSVFLAGTGPRFGKQLDALLSQRTAARLSSLELYADVDARMLQAISSKASTLTFLALRKDVVGLNHLALPSLERLEISPPVARFAALLEARLPRLTELRLSSRKPLPASFLEGLIELPWFKKLESLEFDVIGSPSATLDEAGMRVLLANAKKLKHLKMTWVELTGRVMTPAERKQAQALFGKSNARLLKRDLDAEAQAYDPFEFD